MADDRPELRAGKLPRNTALLYRRPGQDDRPTEYVGVLKLSSPIAKVAAGAGLWITVRKREGTAPDTVVLALTAAAKLG
jgi:hypothetical protein